MFDYLFTHYRVNIYPGTIRNLKNLTRQEIGMLVALIVCLLSLFCFTIFLHHIPAIIASLLVLCVDAWFVCRNEKKWNHTVDIRAIDYQVSVVAPLVDLLNHDPYRLYHKEGLDWLISCCNDRMQPSGYHSIGAVTTYVFPTFTLAFGVILNSMSPDEVISITLVAIVFLFLYIFLYKSIFASLAELYFNPYKPVYQSLKQELEYIRVQLVAQSQGENIL